MPFRDIVGHRRLVALLSRAAARSTVPPSLLLAGPEGVGKRRVAVALAQALNCLQPVTDAATASATAPDVADGGEPARLERDACGACAACRRIARGIHPDVIVLEPGDTGSIKIEPVREIIDRAQYRPFEGRRRVVIIDRAEALTADAQSALLKILEEPPSGSVFLLLTPSADALLATVQSRCPRLRFGRLTAGEVANALMRDHGYTDADARAVAADADGSLGRALEAEAADVAAARATAQQWLVQTARSDAPGQRVQLAQAFFSKKALPAVERARLAACLRALSSLLRDLGVLSTRADARVLANADLQGPLERLASAYDSARSMRAFTAVDRALGALERNASPKIVANWLVLQL
jgi:DNA polymerase-3 subunit delta'